MQQSLFNPQVQHRPNLKIDSPAALVREQYGPELSVLSYGVGQDSHAIMLKLIYDREFRNRYAPNRLLVVTAETGDEHPQTYQTLAEAKELCAKHGIDLVHITPDMGFHSQAWPDLRGFYRRTSTCGSKTFRKSCTDMLKIKPIYRFLEHYIGKTYQITTGKKQGFIRFAQKHGKVRVMVGLSKGEERRMAKPDFHDKQAWRRLSVETVYPLADIGYGRAECQCYIKSVGHEVPLPSNCLLCPFMSEQELVWLYRFRREDFDDWVLIEQAKLLKFAHKGDKNYGVWGKRRLPEVLEIALDKYGHWTDQELWDYKMTHGHCVTSSW